MRDLAPGCVHGVRVHATQSFAMVRVMAPQPTCHPKPLNLQAIAEEVAALDKQLAERSTTLRELKRTLLQVGSAWLLLVGGVCKICWS